MKIGTKVFKGEELEARLCAMLDYIVSRPKMEPASEAAGFNKKYIWKALSRSGRGDPNYLVTWPDRDSEEKIQFADAVVLARNMWRVKFDSTLREDVEMGIPRVVLDQNHQVVYEKDPQLLAEYGGETAEACRRADADFVFDYPYKHVLNDAGKFERVPLVVYDATAASLRQHVARSLLPDMNPSEHRSVTSSHSGAVLVLGARLDSDAPAASPIKRDLQARIAELRASRPQAALPPPTPSADDTQEATPEPKPVDVRRMSGGERVGAGRPAPGGFSAYTGKPT